MADGLLGGLGQTEFGQNLLGTTPDQQRATLLNVASSFMQPIRRGETRLGKVFEGISGSAQQRATQAEQGLAQRMASLKMLIPAGKTMNDLTPEGREKVKKYLQTGSLADVVGLELDFGVSSTSPLSTIGKQVADMGFTPGTLAYQQKVAELSDKKGSGVDADKPTAAEKDMSELDDRLAKADELLANGEITQDQHSIMVATARKALANFQDPLSTEFAKEQAKLTSELTTKMGEQGQAAGRKLRDISNAALLLDDPETYTGVFGEAVNYINAFRASVGLGPADAAAKGETLRVLSMQAVMEYIQQTKGAISNKEMEQFAKATIGLGRTKEGNRMILDMAAVAADYSRREGAEYFRWHNELTAKGETPTVSKWEKRKKQWKAENGFALPTLEEIQKAIAGTRYGDDAVPTGDDPLGLGI